MNEIFDQLPRADDPTLVAGLIDQLEALGPPAIPALEERLASSNQRGQLTALMALQRLNAQRSPGQFTDASVRRYLDLVSDENALVRTYAMESLVQAGGGFRGLVSAYRSRADADVRGRLDIVLREMRERP